LYLKNIVKVLVKKSGYFDDRNGIFFEEDENGVLNFVIRSYVTGTAKERTIKQDDWNGDKLNGKGPSKWKIDTTKTQLAWFDFQWLGVGRVRCGFVHEDEYVLCHTFYNSDILDKVFMTNPNLPLRCEIENISSNTSCNFDQICGTVISEGGYSEAGYDFSVLSDSANITGRGVSDVIGIKLKNTFDNNPNRIYARLLDITIFSSASNVEYEILKVSSTNTTAAITGNPTTSANNNSGVEYINECTVNGTIEVIGSGIVTGETQGQKRIGTVSSANISDAKKNFISQNFNSTFSDAFVVRVTELENATTGVTVSITWREVY
jgi:hypothetical protein